VTATETETVTTDVTETVDATETETAIADATGTETVIADVTEMMTVTETGPGLNRDLTQDRSVTEKTADVRNK